MRQSILHIDALFYRFDGVAAVDAVSFDASAGATLGIIGPNGAGKSTLLSLIGGQLFPQAGTIEFDGTRIDRLPAHQRCALGLVRTFQAPRPFRRLTVRENLLLAGAAASAAPLDRSGGSGQRRVALERQADALLRDIQLSGHADHPAGELSGGQQKLLDVARAVMTGPRLLLLDEPCAGVTPALKEVLSETLATLRSRGVTVVVVEHDIAFVARHCDEVLVLAEGRALTRGTPGTVGRDPRVHDAFLGIAYG